MVTWDESAVQNITSSWNVPTYVPSIRRHTFPDPIRRLWTAKSRANALGKITESTQNERATTIVYVSKRDGSLRFCAECLELSSATVRDSYPLLHMDNCINFLGKATVFLRLDNNSGYRKSRWMRLTGPQQPLFPTTDYTGSQDFFCSMKTPRDFLTNARRHVVLVEVVRGPW